MNKRNKFNKSKKTPYDIRKEAMKRYSRSQKRKTNPTKNPDDVEKLNKGFDFAKTKLKAGSADIQMYLDPLLHRLAPDLPKNKPIPKNYSNDYFSVDSTYDGDTFTLFQHVKFKKLPNDPKVQQFAQKILEDPHMSKPQYEDYKKDWHHRAYKSLTKNLGLTKTDILEEIMNSSAMWRIATVSLQDSDQNKETWMEMYNNIEQIYDKDLELFDWIVQQIENEKHTISWIVNAIDDEFKRMLAGQYSHRLHKWYKGE